MFVVKIQKILKFEVEVHQLPAEALAMVSQNEKNGRKGLKKLILMSKVKNVA